MKSVFQISHSVGIAGGQDNKSLFFTGIINPQIQIDPYLIYLDPHYVQEASPVNQATFSCKEVRTLRLSKIATSVAMGFYIKDGSEFAIFRNKINILAKSENSIFSVIDKQPKFEYEAR